MVRQVQHVLRETRRLDDTPNLDRPLILYQRADGEEQLGRELAIPAVLPRHQSDDAGDYLSRVLLLLIQTQDPLQGLGAESLSEAGTVCLDRLLVVLKTFGKTTENLPFLGRLLVLHGLGTVLRHLCAPDGVDAQVLIQHHEEAIEPTLAETLVVEAGQVFLSSCALNTMSVIAVVDFGAKFITYIVRVRLYRVGLDLAWVDGVCRLLDLACRIFAVGQCWGGGVGVVCL